MTEIRDPDACTTMVEVRAGVDALDRDLVALLARRFGYMRAAARIKPERGMVRDEGRKAQVIANAVAAAERMDVPTPIVATMWEDLVEASIAYEMERFDAGRANPD
ncbi:chorismate mutase [uncultured Sphingomonas sp.]|uniref:chorismate mutase n=1 Tax=uncultured Sphingomonas sp. TaxID=158754 RepID=UPI0025FCC043|nr:chorismate mutase [uncultured Sphingomonas sp.]